MVEIELTPEELMEWLERAGNETVKLKLTGEEALAIESERLTEENLRLWEFIKLHYNPRMMDPEDNTWADVRKIYFAIQDIEGEKLFKKYFGDEYATETPD